MAIVRRCYSLGSPSSRRRGCPLWRSFPRALQRPLMLTRSPRTGAPCRSVAAPLADRQAGMRADAACKGEGRLLLGGRWRWQGAMLHTVARSSVGRSVGRSATIGEGASKRAATLPHTFLAGGGVTLCTPLPPSSYRCNSSEFEVEEQRDGNRIGWAVKEGPRSHFGLEG